MEVTTKLEHPSGFMRKDPNGIMANDIAELRKVFPKRPYGPNETINHIMYEEGKQAVLDYIERRMVSGHGRVG